MSGYNKKTGIFELTYTKAEYWHRKPIDAAIPYTGMRYFVEVLRKAGLDVEYINGKSFTKVKGTPEQIWVALSGTPSNHERSLHYYK